jgi:hypothetical protein
MFVCIILPLHIAFNIDTVFWCVSYYVFDAFFFVDMLLNFFSVVPGDENSADLTDKRAIAHDYLTGWFSIDFLSILPMELIVTGNLCVVCQGEANC